MRIQYSVSGGLAYFPGLARPRTLDTDSLPQDVARDLITTVRKSDFFALPDHVGATPAGAADMQKHTLTVEDGERTHTVQISDSVPDPVLQDLLQKVDSLLRFAKPA